MKNKYLVFVGIGAELVVLETGLVFAGRYFDQTYGTKGLGVAGGCILGLVLWVFHLMALVNKTKSPSSQK